MPVTQMLAYPEKGQVSVPTLDKAQDSVRQSVTSLSAFDHTALRCHWT